MTGPPEPDAHTMLDAEIRRWLRPARAECVESHQRRWMSATFAGARHNYVYDIEGGDSDTGNRIRSLAVREFSITGHLVADIVVTPAGPQESGGARVEIEALTVETD